MQHHFKVLGIALALASIGPATAFDDTIPPARITTLIVALNSGGETVFSWWSTGDDGMSGTATSYEFRYSTAGAITDANWDFATPLTGYWPDPLLPREPGLPQDLHVIMQGGLTYGFAIRVVDDAGNRSLVSNSPMLSPPDTIAPEAVTDLVATAPKGQGISCAWTNTGDDGLAGTASHYEIRRSTQPVTAVNWSGCTIAASGAPGISGSAQSVSVAFPQVGVIYCYAMKTRDEAGNWSPVSNWVSARARR